jgi:ribosomal protein S7
LRSPLQKTSKSYSFSPHIDPTLLAVVCKSLIGSLTKRGSKQRGEKLFHQTLDFLRLRLDENPLHIYGMS